MNVKQRDRRFLARDEPPEDVQVTRTEGSHVFDANSRKYIDFFMGWCVGNVGWGNRALRAAVARSRAPDYVSPTFLYKGWADLAERLASLAPGRLTKCYRATGGTEAVEIALQVAMASTGRHKFASLEGSYHGNSIATRSVASSVFAREHRTLQSQQIAPPLDAKAADRVESLLRKKDVAAFIMEPVVINLGVLLPDRIFMTRLGALCRKYGTLLIADEVATGFGRTGTLFASEHFGLEPDIMCLGKAIAGGYGGLGATIATDTVAKSADEGFWSTSGWHPRAVEAALANLSFLRRNRRALLARVVQMGNYFRSRLETIPFKRKVTVHSKGLAIAVDLGTEGYASKVQEKCRKAGLLISVDAEMLQIFPALTIDRETARRGLDLLEKCV